MRCYSRILITACIIVVAGALLCPAQVVPDSKGRDFWLTFLPNFHNNESNLSAAERLQHELQIYIAAERPTKGTISWRKRDGTTQSQAFTIADVRTIHRFAIFYQGIELKGYSGSGAPLDFVNSQNETPAPQHFRVQADDDVTVYALNQAPLTSEAFLILPTDALAEDYVVMSYDTDVGSNTNPSVNSATTPSQFAIVASEDSTDVTVRPSVPTIKNSTMAAVTVRLDKGQSYLVQADPRRSIRGDLTGSIVRASKPVAVFSGQMRATVPIEIRSSLQSRDCLIEQMNPVQTWGKSAFVAPFAQPSDDQEVGYDVFRVVAAFDSTEVFVNEQRRAMLMEGEFYQDKLLGAYEITTTRPTLTAQFKKSSGIPSSFPGGPGDTTEYGDPLMMLVPPAEQFMNSYRFVSIQSFEYEQVGNRQILTDSVYKEQWLNVVIPDEGIPSLQLDGNSVPAGLFKPIASSGFSYASIKMRDGVHNISADTLFGIYVYGYGGAVSYGYIGGMAFRPLDVFPPVFLGAIQCGAFRGRIADSVLSDTKVRSITVIPGTDTNTVLEIPRFNPPQAIVPFSVRLQDDYLDGSIGIEAIDGVQQKNRQTIRLAGFTVAPSGARQDRALVRRGSVIAVGRERCDSIEIENYGTYPRTFTASFTGASRVDEPQPVTLLPGERRMLRYCRTGTAPQLTLDTLVFSDSCLRRPVAEMTFEEKQDKQGPTIQNTSVACDSIVRISIFDESSSDLGLQDVRILDSVLVNCTVDTTVNKPLEKEFAVRLLQPYRDAIYGFEATDSAGNVSRRIDTIPGFMMSIGGSLDPVIRHQMGMHPIGSIICDTLELQNIGITAQTFSNVFLHVNTIFSVPQSQFEIALTPSGRAALIVCFSPTVADTSKTLTDTLGFEANCLVRRIILSGRGSGKAYQGISRCDVPVNVVSRRLGRPLIAPQPANDVVVISFGEANVRACTIRLVDLMGAVVWERSWSGEPTSAVSIDCSDVPNGHYGCQIITDQTQVVPVVIAR